QRRGCACGAVVVPVPVAVCYFFFQAEDGIRDATVTGVQTCALPISERRAQPGRRRRQRSLHPPGGRRQPSASECGPIARDPASRSEERRVGKECRSRWTPTQKEETKEEKTMANRS